MKQLRLLMAALALAATQPLSVLCQQSADAGVTPELFGTLPVQCIEANKPYQDSLFVTDRDLGRVAFGERLQITVMEPATGFVVTPATIIGPGDDTVRLVVSGTAPMQQGKHKISLLVRDAAGNTDHISYLIAVSDPLTFNMPVVVANSVPGAERNAFQTLRFGLAQRATTGDESSMPGRLDSNYCEYELPPKPPRDAFDARWTIITTNGTQRSIFPDNPAPDQMGGMVWKCAFQAGHLANGSPNYPVTIKWSLSDANRAPRDYFLEDQFWNDQAQTGLFQVNMKTGTYIAGSGIGVQRDGDTMTVTIALTTVEGFKIAPKLVAGIEGSGAERTHLALTRCTPNPFSGTVDINFEVARGGVTTLEIVDARGTVVRSLVDGTIERGIHVARWDGTDQHGVPAASGTYLCRLSSGGVSTSRSVVLAR